MNWIKYLALCLPLTVVLVGCAPKETTKTESTESVEMSNPPAETEDKVGTETKTDEMKTDEATKPTDKAVEGDATKTMETKSETKTETKKTQ
jgi:hypothetical protein